MEIKDVQASLDAMQAKLEGKQTEAIKAQADEITALKGELETLTSKLEENKYEAKDDEFIVALSQKVEALVSGDGQEEVIKTVSAEIAEKADSIKGMINGGKDVEIEAALFQRSGVANNEHGNELASIGQLATRNLRFREVFGANTYSNTDDNGTIKYLDWDESSVVRAAAVVAEGGTFPSSEAGFEMKTTKYKKYGDSINMTEEVLEDELLVGRELESFLQKNVEIAEDTLMTADLIDRVSAYVPVAAGVQDANIGDLIVKVNEALTAGTGSKYAPNFVFMNISDINKYKLHKDANNNYILPNILSSGELNVDGIKVIANNAITANTCVVGDNSYGRIYDKKGYMLSSTNTNGTEFLEDKITIKGRKRSIFLIREADLGAFAKVTSISAALTTLAS